MSERTSSGEMQEADLGLGDGLKPGGLTILASESPEPPDHQMLSKVSNNSDRNSLSENSGSEDSEEGFELTLMPIRQVHDLKNQYSHLLHKSSRCKETYSGKLEENPIYDERYFCDKLPNLQENCQQECKSEMLNSHGNRNPAFPTYADVAYGTSIRQQKELFNHNIEEIKKKMNASLSNSSMSLDEDKTAFDKIKGEHHKTRKKRTCEEIAMKLAETLQEVEDLKIELETCEQRLDAKYKAIDILKKQAEEAQSQLKFAERTSRSTELKLSQEISTLQYEVECRMNMLLDSQEVWAQRFDRMCQENKSLMKTLETKMEDLRKITAQKMAVERENDELLALLDIQERAKYEKTRSVSSEENYCTFSTTELAVLGACRCRVSSPEPCGCAHAAANLKKEIVKMKEQLHLYQSRRDEAYHTVDAYRKAFEEQLQRNKALTLQLANISTGRNSAGNMTGSSKARLALKWLIGSLNDEVNQLTVHNNNQHMMSTVFSYHGNQEIPDDASSMTPGPAMSEYELITYLTEMLNEKKEVLAHQKLASQILADRVKVLEEKLSHYEKEDTDVFS